MTSWGELQRLLARVVSEQGDERRALLVLADASFHVHEVLPAPGPEPDLLGFVVFLDDPDTSRRTDETALLFVRREQVLRVMVRGYDAAASERLGFSS